ncbi:MAG: hypothetical protein WCK95_23060 [Alphaproteobacteria bacterium]
MCDPITMMTMGTAALSTALDVTQQLQRATQQRGDYNYLATQQRNEADVAETRARQAEAAGEADADKAREKASLLSGKSLARLAAQGTDLLGSPLDVLGDIAASGQADALSLRYEKMHDAWENRVQGARRQAQARTYETAAANVDPTLGIARSLLS